MEKICKHFFSYGEPPYLTEICKVDDKPTSCGGLCEYCPNGQYSPVEYEPEIGNRRVKSAEIL